MKVCLDGLFESVSDAMDHPQAPGYRFVLRELLKHLKELHERKAEGEAVLNEFFGCYVFTQDVTARD